MVGAGAAAAVLLGVVGVQAARSDDGAGSVTDVRAAPADQAAVVAWRDEVLREFSPLAQSSFSAVRTITEWNLGRATAEDVAARVDIALATSQETVAALASREPVEGTAPALAQYRAGADLYLTSLHTVRVATRLPDGALQTQLRRAAARQRDLGDRLFDLAGTTLSPLLPAERDFSEVRLEKPPEVPDYTAIDLGVGPPLESRPPTPGRPRTYQSSRPEQDAGEWLTAVSQLDLPSSEYCAQLASTGSAEELATAARQAQQAADTLHSLPDPRARRGVSTQLQLALLVLSDGLRAAQAAALVPPAQQPELRSVAQELVEVGASLRSVQP